MIETLRGWLHEGEGSAPVALRLSNSSSYAPYILRAADEQGVIVSPNDRPKELIAYPWASVFGIMERPNEKGTALCA